MPGVAANCVPITFSGAEPVIKSDSRVRRKKIRVVFIYIRPRPEATTKNALLHC